MIILQITKDFILRHQIINGNRVHYKPGWDCHGLPIEMKAKAVKDEMNPLEIRANGLLVESVVWNVVHILFHFVCMHAN